MTTGQLIEAIAGGDRGAFATLYRAKCSTLIAYASAMLAGDRASGEDVVDEAFLDVWRSAASFAGAGDADGWIRRIVRNKAVDLLRKRREVISDDPWQHDDAAQNSATVPTPFDHAVASDRSAGLRQALGQLPPEQREAVWLCYFEELPLRDIAAIAGCPENTVKTRLFHARKRMRSLLTV